jgi:hypothetical protein
MTSTTHVNRLFSTVSAMVIACLFVGVQQSVAGPIDLPELIYYKFDEGAGTTTANFANPGAGSNPATLAGLTFNGTGFSGASLAGNGGSSNLNYVSTGWNTSLGSGDWTIAMWISPLTSSSPDPFYFFGDAGAGSLRMFTSGVAEAGNLILRGPLTDTLISSLSTTNANHVAWVYSSSAGAIYAYLNGTLANTVSQVSLLNIPVGSGFKVGGYSSTTGMPAGHWLDEFQIYSRALSDADVVSAMNADFNTGGDGVPEPSTLALLGLGVGLIAIRRKVTGK